MQNECNDVDRAYKKKLKKMMVVRDEKLAANKKVISDVEVYVVATIRAARAKLANGYAKVPNPI
jgi:hypothetical protein